jgi:hypothetical protein
MEDVVFYTWRKGVATVSPKHNMVKHWAFTEDSIDEARLAHQMAVVAEKSGMTANDLMHLFPALLRTLKNNSAWSK